MVLNSQAIRCKEDNYKVSDTQPSGKSSELVGARLLHLLPQTAPLLESPTGAFIASQPQHSHFR